MATCCVSCPHSSSARTCWPRRSTSSTTRSPPPCPDRPRCRPRPRPDGSLPRRRIQEAPVPDTTPSRPAPARTGPVGPVDATRVPRYAGPATFARLPRTDEVSRVDVAVLGVPFDSGVSYRPGARFGPSHIRASSKLLRPYNPALEVHPFGAQQVADAGDIGVNPFDIGDALSTIETAMT